MSSTADEQTAIRIAVASGKGGTGKTTIATSLATIMAESDPRVAYVDCDVEAPNGHLFLRPEIHDRHHVTTLVPVVDPDQCTNCGACAAACRFAALLSLPDQVLTFPELCHGCGNCALTCPTGAIHETPRNIGTVASGRIGRLAFRHGELNVGETLAPTVIKAAVDSAPADHTLVLDAPPGVSCPVLETARAADVVLLVTEPTPFGQHDLELAVETMRELGRPFAVAVNRAGIGNREVFDYCRRTDVPILCEFPDDRQIATGYARGELAITAVPALRAQFRRLATQLRGLARSRSTRPLPVQPPTVAGPAGQSAQPAPPGTCAGPELVVISGKGGTGKTSVVASFVALAGRSGRPAIADCDVDAADLHLVLAPEIQHRHTFSAGEIAQIDPERCRQCGLCRDHCRFEAIQVDETGYFVDPAACEGCGVCSDNCPAEAVTMAPSITGEWFQSGTRWGPMVHARLGIARENSGKLVSLVRGEAATVAQDHGAEMLICDGPPGVGCPVIAAVSHAGMALIVTEPTPSGLHDFRRAVELTRRFDLPTAVCVNKVDIDLDFSQQLTATADELGVPVLGQIRYDESVVQAQLRRAPVVEATDGPAAADLRTLWDRVQEMMKGITPMKIAVPVSDGVLAQHFGHCSTFALFDVDLGTATVTARQELTPPCHEPGVFPRWLAGQGATVVIAGGMGSRAQELFTQQQIEVVLGADAGEPDTIVRQYLTGQLTSGHNFCDH